MMRVTFSADGRVTVLTFGTKRDGHWSIDSAGRLRAGDPVNLEADILGKYVERIFELGLPRQGHSKITADYLKQQGF